MFRREILSDKPTHRSELLAKPRMTRGDAFNELTRRWALSPNRAALTMLRLICC